MAVEDKEEVWVHIATWLPASLRRQVGLHCLKSDTTMMEFLVAALREKLAKGSGGRRRQVPVEENPHHLFRTRHRPTAPTPRTHQNKTAVPKRGQRRRGRRAYSPSASNSAPSSTP
jgi:hypothetical protein